MNLCCAQNGLSGLFSLESSQSSQSSEDRLDEVTSQCHQAGVQIKDKGESCHKSMKESHTREDDLVALTAELKVDVKREKKMKEDILKSYESWIERREEARRAEAAAHEAEFMCKRDVAQFLAATEIEEERCEEVAEKAWQASQSNHTNSQNLEADLYGLMATMKARVWSKSVRLWAESK